MSVSPPSVLHTHAGFWWRAPDDTAVQKGSSYLTDTMRFINDETGEELPLVQILQGRDQPVTGAHLEQKHTGHLNTAPCQSCHLISLWLR